MQQSYDEMYLVAGLRSAAFFGSLLGAGGAIIGLFSKKKDKLYSPVNGDRNNIRNNKIGLTF